MRCQSSCQIDGSLIALLLLELFHEQRAFAPWRGLNTIKSYSIQVKNSFNPLQSGSMWLGSGINRTETTLGAEGAAHAGRSPENSGAPPREVSVAPIPTTRGPSYARTTAVSWEGRLARIYGRPRPRSMAVLRHHVTCLFFPWFSFFDPTR
jgi:hypothetical protein